MGMCRGQEIPSRWQTSRSLGPELGSAEGRCHPDQTELSPWEVTADSHRNGLRGAQGSARTHREGLALHLLRRGEPATVALSPVLARGLRFPWGLAFLCVTGRSGTEWGAGSCCCCSGGSQFRRTTPLIPGPARPATPRAAPSAGTPGDQPGKGRLDSLGSDGERGEQLRESETGGTWASYIQRWMNSPFSWLCDLEPAA